jgi:hypothetical protein
MCWSFLAVVLMQNPGVYCLSFTTITDSILFAYLHYVYYHIHHLVPRLWQDAAQNITTVFLTPEGSFVVLLSPCPLVQVVTTMW